MPQLTIRNSEKGVHAPLQFGSVYVNGNRFPLRGGRVVIADVPVGEVRALIVFGQYRSGLWTGTVDATATPELEYWHGDVTDIFAGRAPVNAVSVGQPTLVNTLDAEKRFSWQWAAKLFAAVVLIEVLVVAVGVLLRGPVVLLLLVVVVTVMLVAFVPSIRISRRQYCLLTAVDPTAEGAACRKM